MSLPKTPSEKPGWSSFVLGLRQGLPVTPGIMAFGLVVGAAAARQGLSFFQSLAMNFFVCSGIAQLVALEIWPSVLTWSAVLTGAPCLRLGGRGNRRRYCRTPRTGMVVHHRGLDNRGCCGRLFRRAARMNGDLGTFGVWIAIAAMAVVTYAIRAGGFWLMGYVPLTQRMRSILNALPGSVLQRSSCRLPCAAVPPRPLPSSPRSWSWLYVETTFWRSFAEWVLQY